MPLNPQPLFENLRVVTEQAQELRRQVRREGRDADLERHLNTLCVAIDTAACVMVDVYSECVRANLTEREPTRGGLRNPESAKNA